jgi:hypothetical protein
VAVCEKMMLLLPLLHWYVGVLLLAFIVQRMAEGWVGGWLLGEYKCCI